MAQSLVCMTMSGPFLTGYTQTINDYYDREIDAINEPDRPIPSGENTLQHAQQAFSAWMLWSQLTSLCHKLVLQSVLHCGRTVQARHVSSRRRRVTQLIPARTA